MNFGEMVTQSVLARALSLAVLALVMIAAIIVATVDLLSGHDIPAVVNTILSIGLGTAATMIGVNFGVILQPAPKPGSTTP